jgi:flagellar hook protein FlgE
MSFTQGLSGLSAASSDLEVIGNNVANANTVGFKASQAQFGDLFAAALSGSGSSQIGIGTKLETVAQQFTQGNISTTGNTLDMAINGPGFFSLSNGVGSTVYSRNGQFQLNKNGYIVSSAGYEVLGYKLDSNGHQVGSGGLPLYIPTATGAPAATGSTTGTGTTPGITIGMNLDSGALPPALSSSGPAYLTPVGNAFNPNNASSYNNSTSITTYDSFGNPQNTTMYFVKASTFLPQGPAASPATTMQTDSTTGVTTVTLGGTALAASSTLAVGQVLQGNGFPAGTTIATLTAAVPATVPATYSSFTTSSASPSAAIAPATATPVDITVDDPNQWLVYTTVTSQATGAATGATIYPSPAPATGSWSPTGVLSFGNSGTTPTFSQYTNTVSTAPPLQTPVTTAPGIIIQPNGTPAISFQPNGATQPAETVPFDFSSATQFGVPFAVTKSSQDGYTAGSLSGFTVGTTGVITGSYSNGTTQPLGQIELTTFPNMQGLQPLGNNTWGQTQASGSPVTSAPGVGNNGVLQTGATEDSSTNLTDELVNMMTAQRNYQANAQTIKTQDTILQTLINLR